MYVIIRQPRNNTPDNVDPLEPILTGVQHGTFTGSRGLENRRAEFQISGTWLDHGIFSIGMTTLWSPYLAQ
jgi:hypothetical protein